MLSLPTHVDSTILFHEYDNGALPFDEPPLSTELTLEEKLGTSNGSEWKYIDPDFGASNAPHSYFTFGHLHESPSNEDESDAGDREAKYPRERRRRGKRRNLQRTVGFAGVGQRRKSNANTKNSCGPSGRAGGALWSVDLFRKRPEGTGKRVEESPVPSHIVTKGHSSKTSFESKFPRRNLLDGVGLSEEDQSGGSNCDSLFAVDSDLGDSVELMLHRDVDPAVSHHATPMAESCFGEETGSHISSKDTTDSNFFSLLQGDLKACCAPISEYSSTPFPRPAIWKGYTCFRSRWLVTQMLCQPIEIEEAVEISEIRSTKKGVALQPQDDDDENDRLQQAATDLTNFFLPGSLQRRLSSAKSSARHIFERMCTGKRRTRVTRGARKKSAKSDSSLTSLPATDIEPSDDESRAQDIPTVSMFASCSAFE